MGTRVRGKLPLELRAALPGELAHATLATHHRVRLSPWPSEPVCRRGKSPDRLLMGLRDWFFAVAAATGGCHGDHQNERSLPEPRSPSLHPPSWSTKSLCTTPHAPQLVWRRCPETRQLGRVGSVEQELSPTAQAPAHFPVFLPQRLWPRVTIH